MEHQPQSEEQDVPVQKPASPIPEEPIPKNRNSKRKFKPFPLVHSDPRTFSARCRFFPCARPNCKFQHVSGQRASSLPTTPTPPFGDRGRTWSPVNRGISKTPESQSTGKRIQKGGWRDHRSADRFNPGAGFRSYTVEEENKVPVLRGDAPEFKPMVQALRPDAPAFEPQQQTYQQTWPVYQQEGQYIPQKQAQYAPEQEEYSRGPAPYFSEQQHYARGPAPYFHGHQQYSQGPAPYYQEPQYTQAPAPYVPQQHHSQGPAPYFVEQQQYARGPAPYFREQQQYSQGPAPYLPEQQHPHGPAPYAPEQQYSPGPAPYIPEHQYSRGPAPYIPEQQYSRGPPPYFREQQQYSQRPAPYFAEQQQYSRGPPPYVPEQQYSRGPAPYVPEQQYSQGSAPYFPEQQHPQGPAPYAPEQQYSQGPAPYVPEQQYPQGPAPYIPEQQYPQSPTPRTPGKQPHHPPQEYSQDQGQSDPPLTPAATYMDKGTAHFNPAASPFTPGPFGVVPPRTTPKYDWQGTTLDPYEVDPNNPDVPRIRIYKPEDDPFYIPPDQIDEVRSESVESVPEAEVRGESVKSVHEAEVRSESAESIPEVETRSQSAQSVQAVESLNAPDGEVSRRGEDEGSRSGSEEPEHVVPIAPELRRVDWADSDDEEGPIPDYVVPAPRSAAVAVEARKDEDVEAEQAKRASAAVVPGQSWAAVVQPATPQRLKTKKPVEAPPSPDVTATAETMSSPREPTTPSSSLSTTDSDSDSNAMQQPPATPQTDTSSQLAPPAAPGESWTTVSHRKASRSKSPTPATPAKPASWATVVSSPANPNTPDAGAAVASPVRSLVPAGIKIDGKRKLYLSEVPNGTTYEELLSHMRGGLVDDVYVSGLSPDLHQFSQSKGRSSLEPAAWFGYVTFFAEVAAMRCVEHLNNLDHKQHGKPLLTDRRNRFQPMGTPVAHVTLQGKRVPVFIRERDQRALQEDTINAVTRHNGSRVLLLTFRKNIRCKSTGRDRDANPRTWETWVRALSKDNGKEGLEMVRNAIQIWRRTPEVYTEKIEMLPVETATSAPPSSKLATAKVPKTYLGGSDRDTYRVRVSMLRISVAQKVLSALQRDPLFEQHCVVTYAHDPCAEPIEPFQPFVSPDGVPTTPTKAKKNKSRAKKKSVVVATVDDDSEFPPLPSAGKN